MLALCSCVAVVSAQKRIWLDKDLAWTDSVEAVSYAMVRNVSDVCTVVDVYALDSIKLFTEYYSVYVSDPKKRIRNGLFRAYYSDGTDSLTINYVNNIPEGESVAYYKGGQKHFVYVYKNGRQVVMRQYYPDGNLRREEFYKKDGTIKEGRVYAEDGTELQFEPYVIRPDFPGGAASFLKSLNQYIRYTKEMVKAGLEGKVKVCFLIKEDGTMTDFRIQESAHYLLDREAILALMRMAQNYKWNPGRIDGKPMCMEESATVTFYTK